MAPNSLKGNEENLSLDHQSKYYFLYQCGLFAGRALNPWVTKYPVWRGPLKKLQYFAVYLCKTFLLKNSLVIFYSFLMFLLLALGIPVSWGLAQTLLEGGTGKGGEYLFVHFWEFYYLIFPIAFFSFITPILWVGICFSMTPGLVEPTEKRLQDYLILEAGAAKMDQILFLSYLWLYLFFSILLTATSFATIQDLSIAVSAVNENRISMIQPLADVTGVDCNKGDDPMVIIRKVEEVVEGFLEERRRLRGSVSLSSTSIGVEPPQP